MKKIKPNNLSVEFGFWLGVCAIFITLSIILIGFGCYVYNENLQFSKYDISLIISVLAIILNVALMIKRKSER